jgi:hypothetical protein
VKHSNDELFDIAYRYYPRGIPPDDLRYAESDEHRRLVAARREAGAARGLWRAMMRRLAEQFPGRHVQDNALCCPAEALGAGYDGHVSLPEAPGEHFHTVELRVSFLVPYYVVYATRTTDDPEATEARRAKHRQTVLMGIDGVCWALPRNVVKPEVLAELDREFEQKPPERRRDICFELSPEERSCAVSIAREIEATYGYEPMSPEVGNVIVSDVATESCAVGNARLYDCLLSGSW